MLRRPSVLFVVGAFVLAFLHASLWSAITPLWQIPDEAAHFEVVALMAALGRPVGPADEDTALQARMLRSMWENGYWEYLGLTRPAVPPTRIASGLYPKAGEAWPDDWVLNDTLVAYYSSLPNTGQPLYYLAMAPIVRAMDGAPVGDQLRALRFASAVIHALTVVLIAGIGWTVTDGNLPIAVGTAAFAALHPMFAYIGGGLNNDNGVAFAGAAAGLLVASGWRDGFGWRRLVAIAVACAAAVLAKRTAIFLLAWVPIVLALRVMARLSTRRQARALIGVCGGACAAAIAAALILYALPGRMPAGWNAPPGPPGWVGSGARTGTRAFSIGGSSAREIATTLQLSLDRLGGTTVVADAWARGGSGVLRMADSTGAMVTRQIEPAAAWTPITVTLRTGAGATSVVLSAASSDPTSLLLDDLRVIRTDGSNMSLANPGAEEIIPLLGDMAIDVGLAMGVGGQARLLVRDYRTNIAALPGRAEAALRLLTSTFWGRFGIFARRDNPGIAPADAVPWMILATLALASLIVQLRKSNQVVPRGALAAWLTGALLLVAQTLAPMLSFSAGGIWLPQGRYLFSGMFLLAPLAALAWTGLLPPRWRGWAAAGLVLALCGFAAWCAIQSADYFSI